MIADLDQIRGEVLLLARAQNVAASLDDITVEPAEDFDGDDFLRIQVKVTEGVNPTDEQMEALLEAIEEAVGRLDERTASVRFEEAA